ncbi:hypothetical protein FJ420_30620 [Mesorhizobium sp. B3-1-3]|uniref:hypothetical protein n=1 Tax=unclassified Mesorhizobium TaxID=325217 RepID=UPI00112A8CF7|nr:MULTISPECIES: hypothetical protein [unclassified Mesorhizobium]TPI54206.1 hypothetical protein FJ424_31430 [Mesorhizobium sp. B3-1-8]TPI61432.1 hypothetical protein FJ420_30620 [Mesorhizobium sp. B3-1-3]
MARPSKPTGVDRNVTKRPTKKSVLSTAEAIKIHAGAVDRLASAIAARSANFSLSDVSFALHALPPLTVSQILDALHPFFGLAPDDKLSGDQKVADLYRGGPAFFVSGFEDLDNLKPFRQRGLSLTAEDIANVVTIKQLVGVILWGLHQARKAGDS